MTGKRFVDYFDKDHNYIIQDLQNEDEYQVGFVNCDEDVFLELINQLSDENEQLKDALNQRTDQCDKYYKENEQLQTKNNAYIQDIEVFKEENTHLKLENEQLKTTIQQLRTDNTKQKKLLNKTMKQNKHTTTTIQTMMDTERTELGKSVLKQLWEAIQ